MKKRKLVAVLLAAVMTFTLAPEAMMASAADEPADYSENLLDDGRTVVRVALTGDPGTFDPFDTGDANSVNKVMAGVREGMVAMDPYTLELEGRLAESWDVSDDALVYTVKLYDYIYDSQGNHLTANDVKWYMDMAIEKDAQGSSYLDDVEVLDDYTVQITLNSSDVGVWKTIGTYPICTQAAYESNDFSVNPIGTGPYVVTDYVLGSSVTLEVRDDYWQTDDLVSGSSTHNVDVIDYVIITDSAQLSIALETGLVDIVDGLEYLSAVNFMEGGEYEGQYNVFEYEDALTQMLYLNMDETGPFADDEHLRNAMMYSIDIDGLIQSASLGFGVPAKTFGSDVQASGYLSKWDDESYFDFDLDYAKDELEQSNYDGSVFRIVCANNDLHQTIATVLQSYWHTLGVETEILPYDGALFNTYKNDAAEWDILIDNTSVGGAIQGLWRRKFDPENFAEGQGGANFIKEGELIDVLKLCINDATVTDELTDEFHTILKDMSCARSLYSTMDFTVTTPVVVEEYHDESIVAGACTYIWNE